MKVDQIMLVAQKLKKIEEFMEPLGVRFIDHATIIPGDGYATVRTTLTFDFPAESCARKTHPESCPQCTGESEPSEEDER